MSQPQALSSVAPVPPVSSSKGLAITSLILSIAALLLGVLWPIAILLAIASLVTGIIALVKKTPGKGLGLAGVIIGGVALLLSPLWIAVSIETYKAISSLANESSTRSDTDQEITATGITSAEGATGLIETPCYSFVAPEGYSVKVAERASDCILAIGFGSPSDALDQIQVRGVTGEVPAVDELLAKVSAQITNSQVGELIEAKKLKIDDHNAVLVRFTDSYKLERSSYYIIDQESMHSIEGNKINGYVVNGYSYNSTLEANVTAVVDSLKINK